MGLIQMNKIDRKTYFSSLARLACQKCTSVWSRPSTRGQFCGGEFCILFFIRRSVFVYSLHFTPIHSVSLLRFSARPAEYLSSPRVESLSRIKSAYTQPDGCRCCGNGQRYSQRARQSQSREDAQKDAAVCDDEKNARDEGAESISRLDNNRPVSPCFTFFPRLFLFFFFIFLKASRGDASTARTRSTSHFIFRRSNKADIWP